MPKRASTAPKFAVVEKRRLFLPPDPPSGIPCDYIAWNGAPCQREKHDDGCHVYSLQPGVKHVRIYSDDGSL